MINSSLIGARLKEERRALGLSQLEAAAVVSVTREHWGRCERGATIPGGEMLAAFASAGGDVVYVLTGQRPNVSVTTHLTPKEQVVLDAYRSGTAEQQDFILKAALGFSGIQSSKAPKIQKIRDNSGIMILGSGTVTKRTVGKKK